MPPVIPEAKGAVPRSQWPILEHVVIKNGSVSSYGAEHRMADQAVGYLIARSTAWSTTTAYGISSKEESPMIELHNNECIRIDDTFAILGTVEGMAPDRKQLR